jgi:hypothetical protein
VPLADRLQSHVSDKSAPVGVSVESNTRKGRYRKIAVASTPEESITVTQTLSAAGNYKISETRLRPTSEQIVRMDWLVSRRFDFVRNYGSCSVEGLRRQRMRISDS